MSYGYAAGRRGRSGGGGFRTAVWAGKLGVMAAGLAALAGFARLAVPQLVGAAGAALPRAWAAARLLLVPPYLFVTVHLIILVIWKLSDHRHLHGPKAADPWGPPQPNPVVAAAVADGESATGAKAKEFGAVYGAPPLARMSTLEISPDSGGGESCVTTESDGDSSSASSAAAARRSVARAPATERVVVDSRHSPAPPPADTAVAEEDNGERTGGSDDSLDATWRAIMEKTSRPTTPAAVEEAAAQWSRRDVSVGADEMNRRFEDFIQRSRHSFRRL